MAAHDMRGAPEGLVLNEQGIYCCTHCRRPLLIEEVVTADIERVEGQATGYLLFEHLCPCGKGTIRTSRGWGSHPSMVALFGTQPVLPYRRPFAWVRVGEDDPAVARWRWELSQVLDCADLLLFLEDGGGGSG